MLKQVIFYMQGYYGASACTTMAEINVIPSKRKAFLWQRELISRALFDSLLKLNPITLAKNPVMFVVEIGAVLTSILFIRDLLIGIPVSDFIYEGQISLWLWFTVILPILLKPWRKDAESSGRYTKAQSAGNHCSARNKQRQNEIIPATQLKKGNIVLVEACELIPGDGEVIEGVATVNESAITGESAPVIRESGGDRSAVTGGTTVLSDWLRIKITAETGETFIDQMIALVEGAQRQKTPNEIALNILLAGLTIIFLLAVVTLLPYSLYAVQSSGGRPPDIYSLVSLLVCLIPDNNRRLAFRYWYSRYG